MHASTVLMVRPVRFGYNAQTAVTNTFQQAPGEGSAQASALAEFNALTDLLEKEGVNVIVADDTEEPHTPDSIFPNNWISFHEDGTIVLYPMLAPNRRLERRTDIIDITRERFTCTRLIDLSSYENEGKILEGTGSIVFDYDNRVAYAALSPRTNEELLRMLCGKLNYKPIIFTAIDRSGIPVYHTNVVMCIAAGAAVVCLDCIADANERAAVLNELKRTGKHVVPISMQQAEDFAGNMYGLVNSKGEQLLMMSSRAKASLTSRQEKELGNYFRIIHSSLATIERLGGGSARCMIADIRLPGSKE